MPFSAFGYQARVTCSCRMDADCVASRCLVDFSNPTSVRHAALAVCTDVALVQMNASTVASEASPDTTFREPESSRDAARLVFRALGCGLALVLLGVAFRGLDARRALSLVYALGPTAGLLVVPSVLAVACETAAWRCAIAVMSEPVAFFSLLRVRIASESLAAVLPLGAIWADAARPPLLARHTPLSIAEGIASVAARKYLLVLSQAGYLLAAFLLGRPILEHGFRRVSGLSGLSAVALGAALALAVVAELTALTFRGGSLLRVVERIALQVVRDPARARVFSAGTTRADQAASRFFCLGAGRRWALSLPCLAGWLLEATETWVMLVALGANLSFNDALAVEALVVLGRHLCVFLPAGLGVLELGYATFLVGNGVSLDLCAAFVVAKRLRELSWAALGYVLWMWDRSASAATPQGDSCRHPSIVLVAKRDMNTKTPALPASP